MNDPKPEEFLSLTSDDEEFASPQVFRDIAARGQKKDAFQAAADLTGDT